MSKEKHPVPHDYRDVHKLKAQSSITQIYLRVNGLFIFQIES